MNADRIDENYYYAGDDLGAVYTPAQTVFTVWAPTAREVRLCTYRQGQGGAKTVYPMVREKGGIWRGKVDGDCHGLYYTYTVTHEDGVFEVVDPYARAAGVNGDREWLLTWPDQPAGLERDQTAGSGSSGGCNHHELHVRDFSIHPQSGIKHKGKFLAFAEAGTRGPEG